MPHWTDSSNRADKFVEVTADVIVVDGDAAKVIPLADVVLLRASTTSRKVTIKTKRGSLLTRRYVLSFESPILAVEAARRIGSALPSGFQQHTQHSNEITATIFAWASFSVAWILSYTHFPSAPWLTAIVGGTWMLISGVQIIRRFVNPPRIETWSLSRQLLSGIRSAGWRLSKWILLFAALIIGFNHFPEWLRDRPLHQYVAAGGGERDEIRQLLADGIDINSLDASGRSALERALESNNPSAAIALIEFGARYERSSSDEQSLIRQVFTDHDRRDVAIAMLQNGLDPNYVLPDGDGLLAAALLSYQDPSLIAALLNHGSNPRQLIDGEPVIQYLLAYGYSEVYLNLLLDAMAEDSP